MKNVVGICNLHDCPHLGDLTMRRPLGATTFLGRYGLMDFTLSNFSNSGIDKVFILAEEHVHSVRNHIQSGQVWINNTKLGYQKVLVNENLLGVSKFNTDVGNLLANERQVSAERNNYFIVAQTFMIMSYDYRKLYEDHIDSGADVTILCKHIKNNDKEKMFYNCDVLDIDENGFVKGMSTNTCRKKEVDISLESFIFSPGVLKQICYETKDVSQLYSIRKMLGYFIEKGRFKVRALFTDRHVLPFLSFDHYIRHSTSLLKYEERTKLFMEDWPIYTTTHNTPPALYGEHAIVSNSFIANGCIIKGKVKNSIISRDVVIEEGAVVEDSIIFTESVVGENVKVKYVIADKRVSMTEMKKLVGEKDKYLYINQGEKV